MIRNRETDYMEVGRKFEGWWEMGGRVGEEKVKRINMQQVYYPFPTMNVLLCITNIHK